MASNWSKTFLKVAKAFADQSSCVKRKVGAVLVNDLRIVSTGYNGTPSRLRNCNDIFTDKDSIGEYYGEKLNHHQFSEKYEIHAEQNCIAFAAKNGVKTEGCVLYVTTAPCVNCAKLIIAAGIKKVVFEEDYKNEDGIELLERSDVKCSKICE